MIQINTASITENGTKLNINIETGVGFTIINALLWTADTFKDYTKAKSLTFKLEQLDNTEDFVVTPEELGMTSFKEILFLEFESDDPVNDCCECPDKALAVVTNMDQYYRCMTEYILKSDLCTGNLFSREVCDDNPVNKAITINLLIDAMVQCLELGQFIEAIDILKRLRKICDKCTNCKSSTKASTCTSCNTFTY